MNAIVVVWVLFIAGAHNRPPVQIGPYMDKESCELVQRVHNRDDGSPFIGEKSRPATCIQVRVPK